MPAAAASDTWTTRRLLAWTSDTFKRRGLDSPRLSAEMLLAHVLAVPRLKLYMDVDRPASELERATFRSLVERALRHEPIDYLVGKAPFFSMMLKVTPAVLVPRPSTETLVEHIVQHQRRTPGFSSPVIADIGTGSGAIAVALTKHIPNSRVIATDLNDDALDVARQNAEAQGVSERIDFRRGDLLEPLREGGVAFHYIASNPPYISDDEWPAVPPNVREHEPPGALRGGVDGLRYLRPLIAESMKLLRSPGQLVLEIGSSQRKAVLDLAERAGYAHPEVLVDHERLPRVLVADVE